MLSIKQIEDKAKLENLRIRLEYLDRDLKLGNINKKQYNKEKELICKELIELEEAGKSDVAKAFDDLMGNPMKMVEEMFEVKK